MLMTLGPLCSGVMCNIPRCIEDNTESIAAAIDYAQRNGIARIEPSIEAEDEWIDFVNEAGEGMLINKVPSWFNGGNVVGQEPRILGYLGGRPAFREIISKEAASGYAKLMAGAAGSKADSCSEAAEA